ncbi:hypothetical protein [Leisingera thetidis]|uniref:hypothetical protein n=1 Tax=Leisingera thetidis TaxID=2930199 RepID=UPI0021F7ED5A|nr:hypothetical protein [Leisingera thetidis]
MTRPNPSFDLTAEDVDLIETALNQSKQILAHRHLSYEHCAHVEGGPSGEKAQRVGETLTRIQDLLGRLNSQKLVCGPAASLS